jgi:WD40 repeat protein
LIYAVDVLHSDVSCLTFSPDSRLLATGDHYGVVRIWDVESGQLLQLMGHAGNATLSTISYNIWSVAFSPDGRTLLTAGEDGTVRLWDVQTGAELAIIQVVNPYEGE